MNSQLAKWFDSYAGWGIIVLLCVSAFTALIASRVAVPLTFLTATLVVSAVRYWPEIKAFDFWAFDEWVRTRRDAFDIAEWHPPYRASELFCRPDIVKVRNDAATAMNSIMMELLKDRRHAAVLHRDYDDAQARYNQCNTGLSRELLAYLRRGDLFAKGLLVKEGQAKSERIIPTSRWRVMNLDISKADASGGGWNYVGLMIGRTNKPRNKPKPKQNNGQTK